MVCTLLAFILATQEETALTQFGLRFQAIAVSAGQDRVEPSLVEQGSKVERLADGRLELQSFGETVRIDPVSKRVSFYSGGSGYNVDYDRARGMAEVKPVLSRDRVENLCNLYLRAAWDGAEPLKIRSVAVDDDPLNTVKVQASFTHRGVPHAMHPVLMDLDPLYGRLQTFMCVYPPDPPANLVPRLSIAEARDTAFEALAFFHGSTVLHEVEEFELAIVKPDAATEGRHDWYSAEQLAAGAAGRGILAYSGFFEDREILRSDGVGWHRYRVVIDAETGRVLALWHFRPMGGGAQSSDPSFGWNLGPGALRFTLNGREVSVEGEIERVAAPAKFESSSRLIVESNGMSLLAEFDAGQGLLRTITKKPSYGRPDARTLAALAKLHASS